MQLFLGLRMKVHNFLLQRQLRNIDPDRSTVNLKQANSIGILFDASREEDISTVRQYSDRLKGLNKNIEVLAYHKNPKLSEAIKFPLFSSREMTWYLKPTGTAVEGFINRKFDLLISANIENCVPLEYIAARSNARYRIGRYVPGKTDYYDLMISIQQNSSLKNYIDQVNHYLEILKT